MLECNPAFLLFCMVFGGVISALPSLALTFQAGSIKGHLEQLKFGRVSAQVRDSTEML